MLILDATTKTIEAKLAGVITTNQLPIVASYADITTTTFVSGESDTATNSTTAVTAVAAPAASTQRQVKLMTIYNKDTVAATVTVQTNNNSAIREHIKVTLQVGDTLTYTDGEGWRVTDSSGAVKQTYALSGTAGGDLTGTYPNPTIAAGAVTIADLNGAVIGLMIALG